MLARTGQSAKYLKKGRRLEKRGELREAGEFYRKAAGKDAGSFECWYALARVCFRLRQFADAAESLERAARIRPDDADARLKLGAACEYAGNLQKALEAYRAALDLRPDSAAVHCNIAALQIGFFDCEEAGVHLERALELQPDHRKALILQGQLMNMMKRPSDAINSYARARELDPGALDAIGGEACAQAKLGRTEVAWEIVSGHLDTLEKETSLATAFALTVRVHGEVERAIELLEKVLADGGLNVPLRSQTHFYLGRLHDRAGNYDRAFASYRKGNELAGYVYDAAEDRTVMEKTVAAYTRENLAPILEAVDEPVRPVFIVAMPRSGTSLVESILARHSQIYAGGELDGLNRITSEIGKDPESDVAALAGEYREKLVALSNGEPVVTDKMPHNYQSLGLIQLLFPDARIIHCRRNPLDTCLSNWFQRFTDRLSYSGDLENIGRHYNIYRRYMAHWRDNLSLPMLEIEYEDLVANQEAVSRKMVDFCGLEWEPGCLEFHDTERVTLTASHEQVRQPMYTTSVGRWKHYEKYLGPLKEILTREE